MGCAKASSALYHRRGSDPHGPCACFTIHPHMSADKWDIGTSTTEDAVVTFQRFKLYTQRV